MDGEMQDAMTISPSPPPIDQAEIERGLRFNHIMAMVGQSQSNEAFAGIMALADLLVRRGVIDEEEFSAARENARRQIEGFPQPKVRLASMGDKYAPTESIDIDCAARIPFCQARCCTFNFYLTAQDLDEGVARWDYGNPYWIKREADGYCTHCDRATLGCTIHADRPHVCRRYDCRHDPRVWIDFDACIPAPLDPIPGPIPIALAEPDLGRDLLSPAQE